MLLLGKQDSKGLYQIKKRILGVSEIEKDCFTLLHCENAAGFSQACRNTQSSQCIQKHIF